VSGVRAVRWKWRIAQGSVVALALAPLAWIVMDALRGRLGANPVENITHRTGDWTLRLLLATLAVSPLRRLTGWNEIIRFRRTLGLLTFSYVSLHFLIYIVLDQGFPVQGFAWRYVVEDIAKRPYITVGFTAFLLLLPLAWTSTKASIRRLGGRRWNALHRLIYVAAAGGVLHYLWQVKGDQPAPIFYALALVALLGLRVWGAGPTSSGSRRAPSGSAGADPPPWPRPSPAPGRS
jgi:methionine sulfoxide reductase heme-binding subunit